jgi:hypothetical protein
MHKSFFNLIKFLAKLYQTLKKTSKVSAFCTNKPNFWGIDPDLSLAMGTKK